MPAQTKRFWCLYSLLAPQWEADIDGSTGETAIIAPLCPKQQPTQGKNEDMNTASKLASPTLDNIYIQ